jgi:Xaa-Pro aminopeptidase
MYDKIESVEYVQGEVNKVMNDVISIISKSEIDGDYLYYNGIMLTALQLKSFMEHKLLKKRILATQTIVASGTAGADFHSTYDGPIVAHSPTMIDLFPYSLETGYYADITRTVCRGEPSDMLLDMYEAVLVAQETAISMVQDGVTGRELHEQADSVLSAYGFTSRTREGFPHTLGHGVGLHVHEQPGIYWYANPILSDDIITIEPGLYYEKYGGIRVEDMLLVTETSYVNLSQVSKKFVV